MAFVQLSSAGPAFVATDRTSLILGQHVSPVLALCCSKSLLISEESDPIHWAAQLSFTKKLSADIRRGKKDAAVQTLTACIVRKFLESDNATKVLVSKCKLRHCMTM